MGAVEIASVVACCAVPGLMLLSCLFESRDGSIAKSDAPWLNKWQFSLIVAMVFSTGSFLIEALVYEVDVLLALRWAIAMSLVTLAARSDMKERIISNRQVVLAMLFAFVAIVAQSVEDYDGWTYNAIDAAIGCVIGALIFVIARLISKGGVGLGDVKLFAALGLLLGIRGVLSVALYSVAIAFIVSIGLLVTKKKKLDDRLPMAPFALFGVGLAIAFGV